MKQELKTSLAKEQKYHFVWDYLLVGVVHVVGDWVSAGGIRASISADLAIICFTGLERSVGDVVAVSAAGIALEGVVHY